MFFFAFFVSLFTNQQRQGDDSTKEWYMGDGGLLDNGGLPDAIRRGAECTVALGTEKSWICLLVGTDFFGVKNWQVFLLKKTRFFLVVKKPSFFFD